MCFFVSPFRGYTASPGLWLFNIFRKFTFTAFVPLGVNVSSVYIMACFDRLRCISWFHITVAISLQTPVCTLHSEYTSAIAVHLRTSLCIYACVCLFHCFCVISLHMSSCKLHRGHTYEIIVYLRMYDVCACMRVRVFTCVCTCVCVCVCISICRHVCMCLECVGMHIFVLLIPCRCSISLQTPLWRYIVNTLLTIIVYAHG